MQIVEIDSEDRALAFARNKSLDHRYRHRQTDLGDLLMLLLTPDDIAGLLTPEGIIEALRGALLEQTKGLVQVPPRPTSQRIAGLLWSAAKCCGIPADQSALLP